MNSVVMRGSQENDVLQEGGPSRHNVNVVTLPSFAHLEGFLGCLHPQITCAYHFVQFCWWWQLKAVLIGAIIKRGQ